MGLIAVHWGVGLFDATERTEGLVRKTPLSAINMRLTLQCPSGRETGGGVVETLEADRRGGPILCYVSMIEDFNRRWFLVSHN